ncbi:MAG: hypothetical protein Q8M57_10405, partial [Nitrosomonas sp.]|uniref:hypothetical protein n=1 Tax=Nitrosomonas sp. TaxID=42353 RepID=UPI00273452E2
RSINEKEPFYSKTLFHIADVHSGAGRFLCYARYARFRQRRGYGASKGAEQSRRENQFDRWLQAGFIQYLTKPVNMDALYEAIDGI